MVRLHISLLAVTLAMGSALAFSNEYQRCSELDVNNQVQHHRYFRFGHACASAFDHNNFQTRGFVDEEDLSVRDLDAFDDLEARELLRIKTAGSVFLTGVDNGRQIASVFQSRGLEEDNEDLFIRDLDAFDDDEEWEPLLIKTAGSGTKVAKYKNIDYGQKIVRTFQSRGYQDPEEFLTHVNYFVEPMS